MAVVVGAIFLVGSSLLQEHRGYES